MGFARLEHWTTRTPCRETGHIGFFLGSVNHWGKHLQILWYTPFSVSQQIFTGAGKVTEEQQQQPCKYVCYPSSGQLSTAPNRFLRSSPAPDESQENLSAVRAAPG